MGMHENLGIFQDGATAISAAGYSTNFIDLGVTTPQIGVGQHSPMLCIKTAAAPTGTADTLSIELRGSATNNATNLSGTIKYYGMLLHGAAGAEVVQTDARLATAGAWIWRGRLPYEIAVRYIQLYFNNTTTVGNFYIDAWLEDEAQSDFNKQVLTSDVGNP
ncbi:MAG: hypothetical protein PHG53_09525 [Phycisphaerae bacterium]|nr:hypothetical protein [Phycisphaerae bacterium]